MPSTSPARATVWASPLKIVAIRRTCCR
jgi:hypothetical protein